MKGFDLDDMRQAHKYDLEEEPLIFDEILLQESPHVEKAFPWRMQRMGKLWMITKLVAIPDPETNTTLIKYEMFMEGSTTPLSSAFRFKLP